MAVTEFVVSVTIMMARAELDLAAAAAVAELVNNLINDHATTKGMNADISGR